MAIQGCLLREKACTISMPRVTMNLFPFEAPRACFLENIEAIELQSLSGLRQSLLCHLEEFSLGMFFLFSYWNSLYF